MLFKNNKQLHDKYIILLNYLRILVDVTDVKNNNENYIDLDKWYEKGENISAILNNEKVISEILKDIKELYQKYEYLNNISDNYLEVEEYVLNEINKIKKKLQVLVVYIIKR